MKKIVPDRLTLEAYMSNKTSLRVFRFEVTGHVQLHWHEFYELVFVLSGTGIHEGKHTLMTLLQV